MFHYSRIRAALVASLLALSALCPGSKAFAVITGLSDITSWYGTGNNEAAFVVQWNDGNSPVSLAWGFRWDDVSTVTVADMMQAIAGQITIGTTTTTNSSGDSRLSWTGNSDPSFGVYLNSISYDQNGLSGYDQVVRNQSGYNAATEQYWAFFIGSVGSSYDSTFTIADYGISTVTLTNQGWYGFSYTQYPTYPSTTATISAPVAAVPEPSTILLALGGAVILIVARRRHARKDSSLLAH